MTGDPRHPRRKTHDQRFRLRRFSAHGYLSAEDPEHHEKLRQLRFGGNRHMSHHQKPCRKRSHRRQKDNHQYVGCGDTHPGKPIPDVSGD